MKYSIFVLVSLVLVSVGCSGSTTTENGNSTENSNDNTSQNSSVDMQPDEPGPNLRRGAPNTISLVHWNVEGGGSDQETVARALADLGKYNVVGLTSVDDPKKFEDAIDKKWPKNFDHFQSKTGKISGAANQHSMIIYDYNSLYLVSKTEVDDFEGQPLTGGDYPAPLVAHLRETSNDKEFMVVLVHFAEEPELRQQQVKAITAWAAKMSQPIVIMGSFNFEYNVANESGNKAFADFVGDETWKWVKPLEMTDITWLDADGDGKNDAAGILSDLMFLSGKARSWNATCHVLTRSRDFPDDEYTSNHRPVDLILKRK